MNCPRLLQVCNVGRIVGGTAACAWTVTRALPGFEHHVLFLSPPDEETVATFAPCMVSQRLTVTRRDVERVRPDVVLLHNTARSRVTGTWPTPTLQYLHSAIRDPAPADVTVCCSQWLAQGIGRPADRVLWQAVAKSAPLRVAANRGISNGDSIVVGRICTPQARKWPPNVVPFYAELARRLPHVTWEFVGCPELLRGPLQTACRRRAAFHPAGWRQRSLMAGWDVLLYSNPSLPESFGRTVAEAMRVGCVPVVDRLGGFVEQVPDNVGFLCTGIDEFAAAVTRLSDITFRRRMSERGMIHANAHFSLNRFARDLLMWFDRATTLFSKSCAPVLASRRSDVNGLGEESRVDRFLCRRKMQRGDAQRGLI